jgi:hypothetical protein
MPASPPSWKLAFRGCLIQSGLVTGPDDLHHIRGGELRQPKQSAKGKHYAAHPSMYSPMRIITRDAAHTPSLPDRWHHSTRSFADLWHVALPYTEAVA